MTTIDPSTLKTELENHITILRGVLLSASKAVNVRTSGLESADAVNLYVPFSVESVDGVTGEPKKYIGPIAFWKLDDKTGFWTLSVDGNGGLSFFVKGEAVHPDWTFQTISAASDGVYTVSKVDEKAYGTPDMQHWQVGGV